ncbi:MAG: FAD-dependent oxidoreductase [Deltaproteobacteria bacterium]|nr:FAD-dependent oxidoreductase [Deltaproteobacteria bacterium]
MEKRDVVIIGGGPAGRTIVHMLHASGRNMSVTVIKDEEINVNRCAVPFGINGKKPIEKYQISNTLVTDFGAELVIDRVQHIDTKKKQLRTEKGKDYEYRHLVLSTGSRPLIPPIPGIDAEAIIPVRSSIDLSALRRLSAKGKKAVVVGGGYIGIEVAVALRQMGIAVTIVEMLPEILMTTTEPEFIKHVENQLSKNDLQVLTNEKVVEFDHTSDDGVNVKLGNGNSLYTDFVVLSAGVILNTELAEDAGIKTSRFGICVNDHMQTSADNVYSCGDCAEKYSFVTEKPTRGEFGTNAVFMAKIVAQNILGNKKKFPGVINANVTSIYDLSLGSAGLTEQMAKDAGIDVVTGSSEVLDKYPMMGEVDSIHTKLVFNRKDYKLIGGSVMRKGNCTAQNVDFISFAIQMGATMDDLMSYQYCTHPELAAKPSDNSYVFATRDALSRL